MHKLLCVAAGATLAGLLPAQLEGYELLPGRISGGPGQDGTTTYVRVAAFAPGDPVPVTETLQMYDKDHVQGLGDSRNTTRGVNPASTCESYGAIVTYVDWDVSTQEAFRIIVRGERPGRRGIADTSTIATQTLPGFPTPAAPNDVGAFELSLGFVVMDSAGQPSAFPLPCTESFFFGMELPAPPNSIAYGTDGLGTLSSFHESPSAGIPSDWPKGGNSAGPFYYLYMYDPLTSDIFGGHLYVVFPTEILGMTFAYNILVDAPTLQLGAWHQSGTSPHGADRGFGLSAYLPEIDPASLRTDGLTIRVTDNNFNGSGLVFLWVDVLTHADFSLPVGRMLNWGGGVYLSPAAAFIGALPLSGADTVIDAAPPGVLPVSAYGTYYMQAYTVINGVTNLTNMASVILK